MKTKNTDVINDTKNVERPTFLIAVFLHFIAAFYNGHKPTNEVRVQKAMQFQIDQNKTVVIYNRINNYILDAFLKAVFPYDA